MAKGRAHMSHFFLQNGILLSLSIFFFPLLFLNPLILGTPPEQIFWEILFNSSSSGTTNNHEDYEGPFRPLLSVSLPLRHFRSFSLIRAPSWPAGGLNGQLCTLYKNIGQKTYLKKKWVRMKLVGTSHIIHTSYYYVLLLSMQLLIMQQQLR